MSFGIEEVVIAINELKECWCAEPDISWQTWEPVVGQGAFEVASTPQIALYREFNGLVHLIGSIDFGETPPTGSAAVYVSGIPFDCQNAILSVNHAYLRINYSGGFRHYRCSVLFNTASTMIFVADGLLGSEPLGVNPPASSIANTTQLSFEVAYKKAV